MNCISVQVGDIVMRTSHYGHGHHVVGGVYTVRGIKLNGTSFVSDGPMRPDGNPYVYSAGNYDLVSRGPVEKKRSGFGKWFKQWEDVIKDG